ncbi:hypothetical protein [Mitsuaria sp. CC2]|jgi:hypothetical protein|uniref:hypothetical protein n=1 Tax=Roseateles TaxID=93681 RepID=UPI000B4DED70|nr:hypothetical protein CDL60_25605 [Roseateles noduli]
MNARDERCELAALLERAYRLALWLHDAERVDRMDTPGEPGASQASFAVHVASSELVDVLDEARARLVAGAGHAIGTATDPSIGPAINPAGMPTPARSSAPPDR